MDGLYLSSFNKKSIECVAYSHLVGNTYRVKQNDCKGDAHMIKGFAHNALKVSDMTKSIHFYCDLAGLKKAFEINDSDNNPWIVYLKIREGQFLELFYGGVKDPDTRYSGDLVGYHHFCFEVDNIAEICQTMKDNGILEDARPSLGKDGNLSCWTHDPDGNAVEFVQYMPGSAHTTYEAGK